MFNDTWWKLLLLKLFALLQGAWYNIRTVPNNSVKTFNSRINMELIWKCKCYSYCYISCLSLVWTNFQRAAKCTHYLDCELLSQLKPFRVFYVNRQLYVFPFSFPSVLRSNIQCMVWAMRYVTKRVILLWYKNSKRFVEVTIQVKSHLNQDNRKLREGKKWF